MFDIRRHENSHMRYWFLIYCKIWWDTIARCICILSKFKGRNRTKMIRLFLRFFNFFSFFTFFASNLSNICAVKKIPVISSFKRLFSVFWFNFFWLCWLIFYGILVRDKNQLCDVSVLIWWLGFRFFFFHKCIQMKLEIFFQFILTIFSLFFSAE